MEEESTNPNDYEKIIEDLFKEGFPVEKADRLARLLETMVKRKLNKAERKELDELTEELNKLRKQKPEYEIIIGKILSGDQDAQRFLELIIIEGGRELTSDEREEKVRLIKNIYQLKGN